MIYVHNTHTHTRFSHDSQATPAEMCETAISSGLTGLSFTDHCDCEYADFDYKKVFSELIKVKERFSNGFTAAVGVEMGSPLFNESFAKEVINGAEWDVVLGSVHAVRYKSFTMPFSKIDFSLFTDGETDAYLTQYFADMEQYAATGDFDVLSHMTVPLRYICGRYKKTADINKYAPVIDRILRIIVTRGIALEINTSCMNMPSGFLMPDKDIVKRFISLGGSLFTIGSDAHTPGNITLGLEDGLNMLRQLNIGTLVYYTGRKPVKYKI